MENVHAHHTNNLLFVGIEPTTTDAKARTTTAALFSRQMPKKLKDVRTPKMVGMKLQKKCQAFYPLDTFFRPVKKVD